MKENSEFHDRAPRTDIVMELYEQEKLKSIQSRKELDNNIMQLKARFCAEAEQEADRIMVSKIEFTDQAEFVSLRTELIGLVQSSNVY